MRRKRVSQATSAASSSKRSSAAGSRSTQTSVPPAPIRSAISRAWPPAPKVQSTTVSPGPGAVRSISSPARTGTCVRVMSRRIAKSLRHLPDAPRQARPAASPSARATQTRGGRPRRRPRTSFSIPACARSGGGRITRPDESSSTSKELALVEALDLLVVAAERVLALQRALDRRLVRRPAVQTVMQASVSFAENECRRRRRRGTGRECSAGASRPASVRSGL